MKIRAIVHRVDEGGFWAEVPALPGCVTQGETMDEVRTNLIEAIELWLEAGDVPDLLSDQDQVLELVL